MIKPNSEPCAFHSERKKTVRSAILDFVTKKVQNWKKTNKKLKRKKMDLKKWKKIQEKLINFVVVLFFVNVNRSAVRFFPSLYYCTAHITHSFDYKFNILCIISTLASFSSLTFVFFFLFCIPSLRFWRGFLPSALFFFQSLLLLVVLFFLLVILRFVCVYILVFQSN